MIFVQFILSYLQARARIFSTVKALIKERSSCSKKGDFLDLLLSVHNLSDDEKVSFVLDALLGGYETTSLLMAMAVHFLGQSQPALEELKVLLTLSPSCFVGPASEIHVHENEYCLMH